MPFQSGCDDEEECSELEQVIVDISSEKESFDTGTANARANPLVRHKSVVRMPLPSKLQLSAITAAVAVELYLLLLVVVDPTATIVYQTVPAVVVMTFQTLVVLVPAAAKSVTWELLAVK